jgi:SAM-dependent methyltransferase
MSKRPPNQTGGSQGPGPDRRARRALAHQGGRRRGSGDAEQLAILERAFERAATEDPNVDTHGVHTWPARLHRSIADELLAHAPRGARVLDPFCGSGTTLVEGRARGHATVGVDLNPLALRVAEVKCRTPDARARERFAAALDLVVEANKVRVRKKVRARAPLSRHEAGYYAPHVLAELAGLYEEIQAVEEEEDRRVLEVLLSAIVVKFSRQRADTSEHAVNKRIGRFIPTEFFQRRGHELAERWAQLAERTPSDAPAPLIIEGDARRLRELGVGDIDLAITSPPYGGTYDYVRHHARRYPWLGLDARAFERGEIGARRRLSQGKESVRAWKKELSAFLASLADVLTPGGLAVLLQGDAHVGGRRVPADEQLTKLAPGRGLRVIAICSEERPDHKGDSPREEHLVALARA